MEYSNLFVCMMGLGTVFFGLICIVALTYLISFFCRKRPTPSDAPLPGSSENREELVAAVSAALAEELGTGVSGIRILSMKKL